MHHASEMDQFELHRMLSRGEFDDLLEMASKAPEEIHLFSFLTAAEQGLVAVAISERAKQELQSKLGASQ